MIFMVQIMFIWYRKFGTYANAIENEVKFVTKSIILNLK